MRALEGDRAALARFLRSARYEIFPAKGVLDVVARNVPKDVTITVTASSRRGLPATVHLAIRLARLGYHAVPHLAARLVRDRRELGQIFEAIRPAGITEVFVVAGDASEPAGEFPDALSLLAALPPDHGLTRIGVTGYPDGHPFLDNEAVLESLWNKRGYATYVVSSLSFDPENVKRWVDVVRGRGVQLPVYIGTAGVADPARLLRVSTRVGVADAAKFLRGHASWLARMFRPGGYDPTQFVDALLPEIARPERRVAGLHVFTFNELGPTERWRGEMLARLG